MRTLWLLCLLVFHDAAKAQGNVTSSVQCSCGYRDPATQELYTDAIIIYFNETNLIDRSVFKILDYEYRTQKGWNVLYRQGANFENLFVGNNDSLAWQNVIDGDGASLELFLQAPTFEHLSDGAELRTLRQDILYGSFRASMRSAHPWVGGSAMSMFVQYNSSESIEVDMLNMNNASNARIMQTINGEFPDDQLAVNYSIIQAGDPPKIPAQSPWDFLELGFDWKKDSIDFWIGVNNTRSVTKDDRSIPQVPQSMYFSHWSTGDQLYMQGPPANRSVANIQWIRAFFNSSLMTASEHVSYDQNCSTVTACSTADFTLRGSSAFPAAATVRWKPPAFIRGIRKIAGYIAAGFSFFGVASLVNAFIRRTPWYKVRAIYFPDKRRRSTIAIRRSLRASIGVDLSSAFPGSSQRHMYRNLETAGPSIEIPAPGYTARSSADHMSPGVMTPLPEYESGELSPTQLDTTLLSKRSSQSLRSNRHVRTFSASVPRHKRSGSTVSMRSPPSIPERSPSPGPSVFRIGSDDDESDENGNAADHDRETDEIEPVGLDPLSISPSNERVLPSSDPKPQAEQNRIVQFSFLNNKKHEVPHFRQPFLEVPNQRTVAEGLKERAVPDALAGAATISPTTQQKPPAQSKQRIDYLAGFIAVACIGVTLRHFSLTFWPYISSNVPTSLHFEADKVLSYIGGPWLVTPLWIGPFFVTSCRFLVQKYFKAGKLSDIGNRMLIRAPRMLIPCFIFMTVEYFLISLGVTGKLEWLPSVSWTTWPYVTPQPNFGVFLNEMVELAYLTLNAAPEVINHYCVGVLWTIPVQLQFSFVALLAGVIIHEVKKPWKRFTLYALFIITGWYGVSWSACHWLGVLLADLSINYNMTQWTHAKWYRLYPILLAATLVTLGTPLVLLFNSNFDPFSFMSWEYGIHPDFNTGRPIFTTVDSIWDAYPDFYLPSFAILIFSAAFQLCVELSTWMQAALSIKIITALHPHVMTIYLLHGLIFWSLGAYIAVSLANINVPYWANLLVTAVCSYALIAVLSVFITPWIEYTTQGCIRHVTIWATQDPLPKRPITAPFPKELIVGRTEGEAEQPAV